MQRYQRRICPKSNPNESAIHRRRCYNHFGKCEYHSFRSPNRWCFILKYAKVWIQGGCNQISIAKEKYTFRFTRNVFFYDFENRKFTGRLLKNELVNYNLPSSPQRFFSFPGAKTRAQEPLYLYRTIVINSPTPYSGKVGGLQLIQRIHSSQNVA